MCVNPDGSIYPCAKACPEDFLMGNVNSISSISEAFESDGFRRILVGSIERREKCGQCPVYRYCNGGCSMDAYHECGLENNGGDSCRIFREIFGHVSSEIQRILDEKPDLDSYNPFVKDAILGKLVNPKTVSLRKRRHRPPGMLPGGSRIPPRRIWRGRVPRTIWHIRNSRRRTGRCPTCTR